MKVERSLEEGRERERKGERGRDGASRQGAMEKRTRAARRVRGKLDEDERGEEREWRGRGKSTGGKIKRRRWRKSERDKERERMRERGNSKKNTNRH